MDALGINYALLAFQILNFILIITYIVLSVIAVYHLWQGDFSASQRVIGALLVLAIPIVGAAGFLWARRRKISRV